MIRAGRGAALALPLGAPAAAEVFEVPVGCEAFLTVERVDCSSEHHLRCEADGAGSLRAVRTDALGPLDVMVLDADGHLIWMSDLVDGMDLVAVEPAADPLSLRALLEEGRDDVDMQIDLQGAPLLMRFRAHGHQRLTGERVVIDGRTLEVVEDVATLEIGSQVLGTSQGTGFLDRDWGLVLSGREVDPFTGEVTELSPVRFAEPGEPGFLALEPAQCDPALARRSAPGGIEAAAG